MGYACRWEIECSRTGAARSRWSDRDLFAKELPPAATSYFAAVSERHGLPRALARVMQLIPGGISEPDLARLFPADRFEVIRTGTSHIRTVNTLPDSEVIRVPAIYAVIRPRQARTRA